jgi:hypothetical protein
MHITVYVQITSYLRFYFILVSNTTFLPLHHWEVCLLIRSTWVEKKGRTCVSTEDPDSKTISLQEWHTTVYH